MRKNWNGIMKVLEIQHVRDGKVIWEDKNLYNTLHSDGEELLLNLMFNTGSYELPYVFYLGLDDRTDITADDTIDNLTDEPTTNGYLRQTASSDGDWTVQLFNGVHRAISKIVTFTAAGGSWGPVTKLFLTDKPNNSGTLIASVPLSTSLTVGSGDSVNMRMALSLRDYPS